MTDERDRSSVELNVTAAADPMPTGLVPEKGHRARPPEPTGSDTPCTDDERPGFDVAEDRDAGSAGALDPRVTIWRRPEADAARVGLGYTDWVGWGSGMSAYGPDHKAREDLTRVVPWRPGEFRVTWRRQGWVHSSSRKYEYEHAARSFVERLLSVDPRWVPVVQLELHVRPVGRWQPIDSFEEVDE